MSNNENLDFDDIMNTHVDMAITADYLGSSISTKKAEQKEISQQIEAFLNAGGRISIIEQDHLADPPRMPISNYGSHPI